MKVVRLTLAMTFAVLMMTAPVSVRGETSKAEVAQADADAEAAHKDLSCRAGGVGCNDPSCTNCRKGRGFGGTVCPKHGKHCKHDCMKARFGYGAMPKCPPKGQGPCPIHGYGPCPDERQAVGPMLRQALQPADQPYFGMQPLWVPREHQGMYGYGPGYGPGYGHQGAYPGYPESGYAPQPQARFARVRALLVGPPIYMTTKPVPPMKTYTTRGPRDFLAPNPPSIGY